jgi:hypothetical protein
VLAVLGVLDVLDCDSYRVEDEPGATEEPESRCSTITWLFPTRTESGPLPDVLLVVVVSVVRVVSVVWLVSAARLVPEPLVTT